MDPCCWDPAVLKMLNNAATIAVAGVGGAFGAPVGAGVSAALCRPPEPVGTAPAAGDGAELVNVPAAGDVPVLPEVEAVGVELRDGGTAVVGTEDVGAVVDVVPLVVGAVFRGADVDAVGVPVGAGSVVMVGVGAFAPPEPGAGLEAPPVAAELGTVVVDMGEVLVDVAGEVEDCADDEVDAPVPAVSAGALLTG